MSGGAGTDARGNIATTRGGSTLPVGRYHTRLDIPVRTHAWAPADSSCPDVDGTYDPGTDILITDFAFVMSLTTGPTSAAFADLNGDACRFAGSGPDHTKHCSSDLTRPCSSTTECDAPGICVSGPLSGVPATGPCCTVGQQSTLVYTAAAFTGGAPIYDVLLAGRIQTAVTQCNAAPPLGTCVVASDPCKD
jgi:hypothetical protein